MKYYHLTLILFFLGHFCLFGQEWGEVSEEHLQLKEHKEDPEANSIILFNKARLRIIPDFRLNMVFHKRIKIFTEKGKDKANIEIFYYHKDDIREIEAMSYNPDGQIYELDDNEIFEEEAGNYKKLVFAMPGVEVGSVIEYRYELLSEYIHRLEPWFFQEEDYTSLSEISVILPRGFFYSVVKLNIYRHDFSEIREEIRNPDNFREKAVQYTWSIKNAPGIKKEPYMTTLKDYAANILFQLTSYENSQMKQTFAKSWDDIAERVWKNYQDLVEQNSGLEEFTQTLFKPSATLKQKMENIHRFVCADIKTSSSSLLFSKDLKNPADVYESKIGSVNEKNLLMLNLLNHAGLVAKPVLISTKSNGLINPTWVQLQQFNRVIAYVEVDGSKYFINSSQKYYPCGCLPPQYCVKTGLLIDEEIGRIIKITPHRSKNESKIQTIAVLEGDGTYHGQSEITFSGVIAAIKRQKLAESDHKEYWQEELESLHPAAVLDSFYIDLLDSIAEPLTINLVYHIPDYSEQMHSLTYFKPLFITRITKNPFTSNTRMFPVNYPYQYSSSEVVKIQFDDSYSIDEKPSIKKKRMSKFSFTKIYFAGDNSIECRRIFKLDRTDFSRNEYNDLKQMYEEIVSSDQDYIVLVSNE